MRCVCICCVYLEVFNCNYGLVGRGRGKFAFTVWEIGNTDGLSIRVANYYYFLLQDLRFELRVINKTGGKKGILVHHR